ncbi:MAG: hypothetical protein K6F30_09305 [Lachnospiraceae bacterium]|nr:hypothetical protein [Lachnospiraceae bacterium]
MSEEQKQEKSVHDVCHSLNEGMPEPSGLVSRFEESLEKFASIGASELLKELNLISEDDPALQKDEES